MTIEAVVFDFGGVLLDWNPRYLYRKIFSNEQEMEYFLTHVCSPSWNAALDKGKPFRQGVEELMALYPQYADAIKMYDTRWEEMCGEVIQGNIDLLYRLKKRYPLYGLSNWSAEKFEVTCPKYDFFNLFDGIVMSGVEKEIKPEPRLFEILIERYRLTPEETLFTDDSLPNIRTAETLGFQAIHFETPEKLEQAMKEKGVVLD
ncbi:MAG: HAD family phosphatase [Alphaproteobacteria bacterium]|nr:HAD family phosphatase [Alphaproteobacteria bacterium]MBO4643707.1 HAD family phosphatase [Alphaproteobacteria bacterium]